MILQYLRARILVLFTLCAIVVISIFGSTIAHSSTGWSTNTNPVSSGPLSCSFSPPNTVSARNGDIVAISVSGPSPCSVNVLRSSDGSNTWSSPQALSTASDILYYSLTLLNDGTIFAMWQENTGTSNATIIRQSHSRDNGITWSSPNTISTAGNSAFNSRFPVAAAYGPTGVAISWNQSNGTVNRTMVRTSPDLAQWTQGVAVSLAGANTENSVIATNDQQEIVVAWQVEVSSQKYSIEVAGSSDWSGTRRVVTTNPLSGMANQNYPNVKLTTLSNQAFALTYFDALNVNASAHKVMNRTTSNAGGTWSSAVDVSGSLNSAITGLSVVTTADNSIVAAWGAGTSSWAIIQSAKGNATASSWSTPVSISPQGSNPFVFGALAANTDGSLMMLFWQLLANPTNPVSTSYSSDNGATWGAPVELTTIVMGYPSQPLTISALIASGYGIGWNNTASSTNTQFVRTFDWTAPVIPPAPAPTPSLPATGFSPLNWVLLLAGTVAVGIGILSMRLRKQREVSH